MKKAWLLIRLAAEIIFGLSYMCGLLLLPSIWQGQFPQTLILGWLGMPRRYHASTIAGSPPLWHFNKLAALAGLVLVTFLVLNGLLWFKDVRDLLQRLTKHSS